MAHVARQLSEDGIASGASILGMRVSDPNVGRPLIDGHHPDKLTDREEHSIAQPEPVGLDLDQAIKDFEDPTNSQNVEPVLPQEVFAAFAVFVVIGNFYYQHRYHKEPDSDDEGEEAEELEEEE